MRSAVVLPDPDVEIEVVDRRDVASLVGARRVLVLHRAHPKLLT